MQILPRWRALWNPNMYHGWGRKKQYFEGWYFKLVNADESAAYAVIPGISMNENGEQQAFIQVMDGKACTATYHRFDANEFWASDRDFEVRIGENCFSADQIKLKLPGLSGSIRFHDTQSWPKMLGAPGIMGWYSFVPFMECFHGVVSLQHTLEGALKIGATHTDFSGGRGYTEKDWGRSFPRAYVWMQSNHFNQDTPASLMASVAHIPWLRSAFIGFISGFWLDGRLFRFATYTGAKQHLQIDGEQLSLTFQNPKTELRIQAHQAAGTTLHSPISGDMTGKINESLQARIQVELLENGQRIFEGSSQTAGLEVAGAVDILLNP